MPQSLMDKAQFAERLGVSVRTLERRIRAGLVPHTRVSPGKIRFTEAQLDEYNRLCAVEPAAPEKKRRGEFPREVVRIEAAG